MDYADCNDDCVSGTFECKMWQPDWRATDGISAITDGYPRLGTEEWDITAGYYDQSGGVVIDMNDITLEGATKLVLAGVASVFALSF